MDPEIQRTIQEIQQEIRELTLVMRNLGNTMSAIGDTEIQKFSKNIDQSNDRLVDNKKILDQFGREIESNRQAVEEDTKAIVDKTKSTKAMTAEEFVYRRQQRSAFRDLSQEMSTTRGSFGRLEERLLNSAKVQGRFESVTLIAADSLKGLGAAAADLGKALYQGQQGAIVAARSLDVFASTVGNALQGVGLALTFIPGLGIAARAAGLALGALGIGAKAASQANLLIADQSDRLYRVYQELAATGVSAADGMLGVAQSAQELGFGLDEANIQAFASLMRTASQDLALMSGSVLEGRKQFVAFNRLVRDDVGRELMNLGMTPAAINEAVAAFVGNNVRMGRAATMTNQQLTQGAIEYIRQLDIMTKLTGQDAKSLQARMDADAREERFRAALLQVERTQGREAADTLRLNIAALGTRFPEVAAGLKDLAGGFVDTDAATKVFMMGIQRVPGDMSRTLGGGFSEIGAAARATSEAFGETLGPVGAYGPVFGNLAEQVELGQLSLRDFNSLVSQATEQQRLQARGADGVVAAQTGLRREQMDIRDSLQDLVKTGVAPATEAMESLTGAVNKAVQGIESGAGIAPPPGPRMAGAGAAAGAPGAGSAVTNATGTQMFRGGLAGAIENFVTQGRGFRSYSAADPMSLFDFGGGVTGNRQNYENLDPAFAKRLTSMAAEYLQATGNKLPFESGQRTADENITVGGVPSSLHLQGRAVDLTSEAVQKLRDLGLLDKYGFKQNPRSAWHISDTGYATGGIAKGPQSGYPTTLHGTEAVVPLPDGKTIPVSVKLDDPSQTGPTFAGYNQYKGYNSGGVSTDIGTLTAIADRLGAFDRATNTITDPKTWQAILQSNIATNYDVAGLKIGSAMLPEIRGLLAEEVANLAAGGNTVEQAVALVREEFGQIMRDFLASQQSGRAMEPLLQELISLQRSQNTVSEKILQVSQN
jgi:hypothetical protein